MSSSYSPIYAAIDLGSNSFRILIGSFDSEIRVLKKDLATVRLSEGLALSGCINNRALVLAQKTLHTFKSYVEKYGVHKIRVCGTEALRKASNSHILHRYCLEYLNTEIDIVRGEEEALLAYDGVLSGFPKKMSTNCLIIDVGGGSTEFIFAGRQHSHIIQSFPVGAVTITEKFLCNDRIENSKVVDASSYLQKIFYPFSIKLPIRPHTIIGSGGTATSLSCLHFGLKTYDADKVHGSSLNRFSLESLLGKIVSLSSMERSSLIGLDSGRGEILPAGALIYKAILDLFSVNQFTVSDTGLLEGIFLSIIPSYHQ